MCILPVVVGRPGECLHPLARRGNQVVKGEEFIGHYNKSGRSDRQYCTKCGGHLMTWHPHWKIMDVYAATLPGLAFKPGVHVNYSETVLPMKDGLPKLKDFPAELGGSGIAVPE